MKKIISTFCLLCIAFFAYTESNDDASTITIAPQLAGNVIIPTGVFNEISPIGFGLELYVGVSDLLFENSVLKIGFGYNFISEEIETINSFGLSSVSALIGYSIVRDDLFIVTPLLGGGYVGHLVDTGESLLFFDPYITIQTEFSLTVFEDFYLSLTPGCMLFFEESNIGTYFSINVGVKKVFPVTVEEQKPHRPLPGLPRIIIERNTPVFSPNGDGYKDMVLLSIKSDKELPISHYNLEILNGYNRPVKVFSGESVLAKKIVWDGRDDYKKLVADGTYKVACTVTYDDGREITAMSESVVVDNTPPAVRLDIKPDIFSPDNDGDKDRLFMRGRVEDTSEIQDWELIIADSGGKRFKTFKGRGNFPEQLEWDGTSDGGRLVESAEDYPLTLAITDEVGNRTIIEDLIKTDILVQKQGEKYKVIISNMHFAAYSSDYLKGDSTQVKENKRIISRLAEILKKFPSYKIVIEGHTYNQYWYDEDKALEEENQVLIKLSKERAENIKQALVQKGIAAYRINTKGCGSSSPLVAFGDKQNRGKNRRVEIILQK
ncbi:MAG: OmpA family protein [Spirochaetales bacterium]|nr:OmpA family protein [Spirochaetales bacterium]